MSEGCDFCEWNEQETKQLMMERDSLLTDIEDLKEEIERWKDEVAALKIEAAVSIDTQPQSLLY